MADQQENKSFLTKAKEFIIGTPEQNAKAAAEMKAQDAKTPDSAQAKINKALAPKKMAKGGTASSRADGCCVKGKTRGRMV
jgi:hypothetical protein